MVMAHGERRFWMKYPTLSVLIVIIVAAYFIFASAPVMEWGAGLGESSYAASLIAGALFASGILAPLGAGIWSVLSPPDLVVAVLLGALGGAIVDVALLSTIKKVVARTTKEVKSGKAVPIMEKILSNPFGKVFVAGIVFELAGFIRALPLPYRLGDLLSRSVLKMRALEMAIMSFLIYIAVSLFFIGTKYLLAFAGF